MADVQQVNANITRMLDAVSRCEQSEGTDNYEVLIDRVEELQDQASEAFQSKLDIASLLAKLKKNQPLTPSDLKTLELLIVGDAEYYLKYETQFDNWKSELKRVMAEIDKLRSSPLDVDGLMHLQALCREAQRVLPEIFYYLDQKERASKFQAATRGPIDAEAAKYLTEIVRKMAGGTHDPPSGSF